MKKTYNSLPEESIKNIIENNIAQIMRDIYLGTIVEESERIVKCSNQNIFGKYVIIYDEISGDTSEYELENWYVQVPISSVPEMVAQASSDIIKFTVEKLAGRNPMNVTCHQLCSWVFLQDEDGNLIRDGHMTLVKYAIILDDLKDIE